MESTVRNISLMLTHKNQHYKGVHPRTHNPNPKSDGQCFGLSSGSAAPSGFVSSSPIKTGNLIPGFRLMFTLLYFVCECGECVRAFLYIKVWSSCLQHRGNSFLRLSGFWPGGFFRISFTGANHDWISHCGEMDQSLRGFPQLVGKFHDTRVFIVNTCQNAPLFMDDVHHV